MDESAEKSHDELVQKLQILEAENKKLHSEFNSQRAKMKDLFMQKECEYEKCQKDQQSLQREFDELKSQLVVATLKFKNEMQLKEARAHEEVSSLQKIVQDTIEESSTCKSELDRLKTEYLKLSQENQYLREKIQQQDTSLAPQVLSQMKKTLVRKLGGESSIISNSASQENCEEGTSIKTGPQHVHEDAEVLHSLVEQLQEEMGALKGKLREADEKLQNKNLNALQIPQTINTVENTDGCSNCQISSLKVDESDKVNEKYKNDLKMMEKVVQKYREDLEKEATLRKDLEEQWQRKREDHKNEVQSLRENLKSYEIKLLDLQQKFLDTKEEIIKELTRLTEDRILVNRHFEILQADNDFLSGRYLKTAREIEDQFINLPNNVVELQEIILQQQQDLIQARISSEYEREKCVSSLDEIQILRDQLEVSNKEREGLKKEAQTKIKSLQDRISDILLKLQDYESTKVTLERKETELNRQISELRVEIIQLQEKNESINKINLDYKSKMKNLQDELLTSEQVQKDFVKLSQNLQMSLEKLRQAENEVRWQHEEDVDNCPSCKTYFSVTVRKIHCRHCGHIYCDKCLSKTVVSGPRRRLARVCDICHTLLTPNTAPYFSLDSQKQ